MSSDGPTNFDCTRLSARRAASLAMTLAPWLFIVNQYRPLAILSIVPWHQNVGLMKFTGWLRIATGLAAARCYSKDIGMSDKPSKRILSSERAAVRAHEVQPSLSSTTSGITNVEFKATKLVGAAAQIATLIKDLETISDVASLEAAAGEIGIEDSLLEKALVQLEGIGFVRLKTAGKARISRVQVSVPLLTSIYAGLGSIWDDAEPSDFEQRSIALLDDACLTPLPQDVLEGRHDLSPNELAPILEIGQKVGYLGEVA
jgi:hypothetical protein